MLNLVLLAYENCLLSGVAGLLDLLTLANWEQRRLQPEGPAPFFRCQVLSADGETVTSFNRLPVVPKGSLEDAQNPDLILIPGVMGQPEQLLDQRHLIAWLKTQHQRGALLASACSGTFLLAEAGILNGRPATTHWQLADRFRQRYAEVDLQVERILIDGGDYFCAGGASAHFDLGLYLIEKFASKTLADNCARTMLIDGRVREQATYVRFRGRKNHRDQAILQAQAWLEKNFRSKVRIVALAERSGLNERTFLRRFRKATGEAPLEYLQQLRIEAAKQLLLERDSQLDQITRTVGYRDVSSFRRLFREITGVSPTVYRQRFMPRVL